MTDADDGDGVDAESPTVHRDRHDNAGAIDDAHRQRVHEAAERALNQDADLFQRLREDDDNDPARP